MALAIGSVALIADSVDFLEDMAVSGLILAGLRFAPLWRARLGMGLALLLVLPAIAGLIMLLQKIAAPVPPAPLPLSLTGLGALFVNSACAVILARVRSHAGSLTRAAFLSARNDAIANVAIIMAGGVTALWPTHLAGPRRRRRDCAPQCRCGTRDFRGGEGRASRCAGGLTPLAERS